MIVVDTNVIYAALYSSRGFSFKLMERMLFGKEDFLMNTTLAMEYYGVLTDPQFTKKLTLTKEEVADVLARLIQKASFQDIYFLWRPNLRDEKDNFLMELAIAGRADALVTFNKKDFMESELKWEIEIMTPKEYFERKTP